MGVHVETGVVGARMEVVLVNDGPATLVLVSEAFSLEAVRDALVMRA